MTDFYSHEQYGDSYGESDGTYGSTVYLYNNTEDTYHAITNGMSETRIDRAQSNTTTWSISKTSGSYTAFDVGDGLRVRQYSKVRSTGSWGSPAYDYDPYTMGSIVSVVLGYDYRWLITAAT